MLKIEVNIEDRKEYYNVMTIKQLEYEFERKHSYDGKKMDNYKIMYEYEYIVTDRNMRKSLFGIHEKTRMRAVGELKRKIQGDPYRSNFIVVELPVRKDLMENTYKVGTKFISGSPNNDLPDYLKELGEWKEIEKGVFRRIS